MICGSAYQYERDELVHVENNKAASFKTKCSNGWWAKLKI